MKIVLQSDLQSDDLLKWLNNMERGKYTHENKQYRLLLHIGSIRISKPSDFNWMAQMQQKQIHHWQAL